MVNVGCGPNPLSGWENIDNSPTLFLARLPVSRLLNEGRRQMWKAGRTGQIRRGSATRLPFRDGTVDVIYSAHMINGMLPEEARMFVRECHRVLKPGGWVRVSVPNLHVLMQRYLANADANWFAERLMKGRGRRGHLWTYDELSLPQLLSDCGLRKSVAVQAGKTNIPIYGTLDLCERADESVYAEAQRP